MFVYYCSVMKELDAHDKKLIEQAENEGMTGRVQPIPKRGLGFDEMALIRAEGEGMVGAKQPPRRQTPNDDDKFYQLALMRADDDGMYDRRAAQRRLQPREVRVLPRPSEIKQI